MSRPPHRRSRTRAPGVNHPLMGWRLQPGTSQWFHRALERRNLRPWHRRQRLMGRPVTLNQRWLSGNPGRR